MGVYIMDWGDSFTVGNILLMRKQTPAVLDAFYLLMGYLRQETLYLVWVEPLLYEI